MELKNAVCIVTGSASGIGAASALMLAGKGARVVVNYSKSEDAARATQRACAAAGARETSSRSTRSTSAVSSC